MSRNINVNPDHYKVRGLERQGEDIAHEENTARRSRLEGGLSEEAKRQHKNNRRAAR